ncbi:MAG TPA: HYR domain-containing protein [Candidatus Nanoarchaeia archaeon]|nr:HYR domain-containing protein [Candidatus Nanoarchaeia archaeon]
MNSKLFLIFSLFILSLSLASACTEQDLNFSSISTYLSTNGIENNLNQVNCANQNFFSYLYFENTTYGKVSFLSPVDISSQEAQDFLFSVPSILNFSQGNIFFATSNTLFQEEPMNLSFYNLRTFFPDVNITNTTASQQLSQNLVAVDEYLDPINSLEIFGFETADYNYLQDIFSIEVSKSYQTYFDFYSPIIDLEYPEDNSIIGPSSSPFSYSLEDQMKMNCSLSIVPSVQIPKSWLLNDSEFFTPSQINVSLPIDLEDGDYIWFVTCTDYSGKSTQTPQRTFAFDPIKPFVDFIDSDYYIYTTNSNQVQTIFLSFSELISNTPEVTVDNEAQTVYDCSNINNDFSTFCFNFSVPQSFQGELNVSVSNAIDAAGNIMLTDTEHTISVDTSPPDISFDQISTIYSLNEDQFDISGSCSLEFQNEYYLSYTGHNESLFCDTFDEVEGFWTAVLNLSNLSDGDVNFTLSALDEPGNFISISEIVFKDSTPPVFVNSSSAIYVEATSAQGANVTFDNITAFDAFDGPVDMQCDYESGELYPIGNTTLYCQSVDSLYNLGELTFDIVVQDTTPPQINFSAVFGILNSSDVQIEFSLYENVSDSISCSYTLDKKTTEVVPCNEFNNLSLENISQGVHKIKVSAEDNASNIAQTRFYTFFVNIENKSVLLPFSSSLVLNETIQSIILEDNYSLRNITLQNTINFSDNISLDLSLFSSQNATSTSIYLENNLTIYRRTNSTNISLFIPDNITLTSSSTWDSSFIAPSLRNTNAVNPVAITGSRVTGVNSVFEIGIPDQKIYSDKAMRILFQGQANKSVGFQRNNTFTRISSVCSADSTQVSDSLPSESDCYINVGNDLVVWTKHLTLFATYTQTVIPIDTNPRPRKSGGGGGGGGGVIIPKKTNSTNLTVASNTSINTTIVSPITENNSNNPSEDKGKPSEDKSPQTVKENKASRLLSRITGRVSAVVSSTASGAVSLFESPLLLTIIAISAFIFISWAFIRWHRNIMLTYFNTPQDPREYKY